ncbi:hypothetical protein ACHAXT_010306 [Thalassiosira profunda]
MVTEQLPEDPGPFFVFFMPNILGILLAYLLERFAIETSISSHLSADAHKYCIFGLGIFALAMVNSYLAGSVVMARIHYGVKLPNLYAVKTNNKNAVTFNTIQRSHQNFLESYAQIVLGVVFTAFVAERPNIAGMMLLTISVLRVAYAKGYQKNIASRLFGVLASFFIAGIGTGYAALIAMTAFGVNVMSKD